MDAYIEVRNVSKRYKDYTVLEDVSYSFERGGRYAITGENGSGKSVFLKLLTGYPPEGYRFYPERRNHY